MIHVIRFIMRRRKALRLGWDVWRAGRGKTTAIAARQQERLRDLVEFARVHSPLYRKLYEQVTFPIDDPQNLPRVTKQDLMANFDDWVTDPAVTRAGVEAFMADKTRVGELYLGRYAVWTSSGVTGRHGIFVHDRDALRVYATLAMVRGMMVWMTPREGLTCLRRGERGATVIRTGGHYVGPAVSGLYRRHYPQLSKNSRTFSVMTPLSELVKELNALQPELLVSFPTVLALLANEQRYGTLKIKPLFVATLAEWLSEVARDQIAAAFNCRVRNAYAASEFMGIAFDCTEGQLHVNADWVILEPIDAQYQPVPPGRASHTVLLTNLVNRVQPIIRYDLGDSITLSRDQCPCGSPLPVIRVEGRLDEILSFSAPGGEVIKIPPRALANVVDGTAGVRCGQIIQTAPDVMDVRLEVTPGSDSAEVWERVACRMRDYLSAQGLPSVRVEKAQELPQRDPVSGKFRTVWAELKKEKG
jgi:putative adenylate-forming enzyme